MSLSQGCDRKVLSLPPFTTFMLSPLKKKKKKIPHSLCILCSLICQSKDCELSFNSCHRSLARGQIPKNNPEVCLEQRGLEFRAHNAILKVTKVLQDKQGICMQHSIFLLSEKNSLTQTPVCFASKHARFSLTVDMYDSTDRSEKLWQN